MSSHILSAEKGFVRDTPRKNQNYGIHKTCKTRKIYVKVNSDFDSTGFMQPRSITWKDGRGFQIDAVKDFRPASSISHRLPGDCYTVVIKGELKHLFFERSDPHFASKVGRWFVEATAAT